MSCEDTQRALHTVYSVDNTFVRMPDHSGGAKAGAMLSLGWSTAFMRNSVLANRMSGTAGSSVGKASAISSGSATVSRCIQPWRCGSLQQKLRADVQALVADVRARREILGAGDQLRNLFLRSLAERAARRVSEHRSRSSFLSSRCETAL